MKGDRLRGVLAPAAELADVDGATLVLLSVELWASSVFLRMAVLPTDATDALDAAHQGAMDAWAAGPRTDDPPTMPGERLNDLPLTIADDIGTRYQPAHRSAAGTGTEWRAEWKFEPGPPASATRLTVALEGDGQAQALDLALPAG